MKLKKVSVSQRSLFSAPSGRQKYGEPEHSHGRSIAPIGSFVQSSGQKMLRQAGEKIINAGYKNRFGVCQIWQPRHRPKNFYGRQGNDRGEPLAGRGFYFINNKKLVGQKINNARGRAKHY